MDLGKAINDAGKNYREFLRKKAELDAIGERIIEQRWLKIVYPAILEIDSYLRSLNWKTRITLHPNNNGAYIKFTKLDLDHSGHVFNIILQNSSNTWHADTNSRYDSNSSVCLTYRINNRAPYSEGEGSNEGLLVDLTPEVIEKAFAGMHSHLFR